MEMFLLTSGIKTGRLLCVCASEAWTFKRTILPVIFQHKGFWKTFEQGATHALQKSYIFILNNSSSPR